MATTRIKDLSKTATTVNSDANLVLDGNTGGTQKITRDNFRQDTADAFVAAPGTYNLAPINSGTGKIDATYLPTSSDTPKGAWNASTNTPTLADGSGTAGDYYDVTVAGSSDLGSGSITFTVGDVVKYDGTTWFKIDSVTNILDGVSTIDGAKAAIEIPDVGTDPSEVPLNQHLGSMAYQSADSVSVAELQVESTTGTATTQALTVTDGTDTNFVVREDGQTIVGGTTSSVSKFGSTAKGLTVSADTQPVLALNDTDNANYVGYIAQNGTDTYLENYTSGNLYLGTNATTAVTIDSSGKVGIGGSPTYELDVQAANARIAVTSSAGVVNHLQADSTGAWVGPLSNHSLYFKTNNTTRWTIDTSGNLVANSTGIDFSATADGSGASNVAEIFDDYETGRVSGAITMGTSGSITLQTGADALEYTKVGRLVTVTGRLKVDSVSSPSGSCTIALPFAPTAGTDESGYCGGGVNYYDSSSGYSVIPWSVNAGTASLFILNFASGAASGDWLNISITYAA